MGTNIQDTMLILCFSILQTPKRINPPKTGYGKFVRLPKFPIVWWGTKTDRVWPAATPSFFYLTLKKEKKTCYVCTIMCIPPKGYFIDILLAEKKKFYNKFYNTFEWHICIAPQLTYFVLFMLFRITSWFYTQE